MALDLQLAVLGLIAGGAFALAAIGLVVIYKGSGVLNFAHGAVGMVGTEVYGHWVLAGNNKWIGVVLGITVSAAIGAGIHLFVTRNLRTAPALAKTVATVGVLVLLQGAALLIWGDQLAQVPELFSSATLAVGEVQIPVSGIWTVGIAAVVGIASWWYFARTTAGLATEASSIDEASAQRLGHRVERLALFNWILGSALAGLAGIAIVGQIGLLQTALTLVVLQAVVAAVVGGFRSISIAIVASIFLGIAGSLTQARLSAGWQQAVPFILLAFVLLIRGQGIPSRGQLVERLPAAPLPPLRLQLAIPAVAVLIGASFIADDYWQGVLIYGCANALVALSLVMTTGYLGQVSLAQWTLAGFGGFTAGTMAQSWGMPMLPAIVIAAIVAFPLGVLVGFPALRVRGLSFAVLTLAAANLIHGVYILEHFPDDLTVPPPDLFGMDLSTRGLLFVSIAFLTFGGFAVWTLRRSSFGKRLIAIRSSERAAQSVGISPTSTKLVAFGLSSSLAALGGGLWVFATGTVTTGTFSILPGITLLAAVFICGVGTVSGGIAAGFFVALGTPLLGQLGAEGDWFAIISGVGLIVNVILYPNGISLMLWERRQKRQRPGEATSVPAVETPKAGSAV